MANTNEYEMFKFYFNEALKGYDNGGSRESVVSNLLSAARYALLISDKSEGKTKKIYRQNAEKLINKAEEIKTQNINKTQDKTILNGDASLNESQEELDSLIGLVAVKKQVDRFIKSNIGRLKEEKYHFSNDKSYHMVFTGNAGTGKTTVARIIGKMFKAMGVLSKGHLVEVTRSNLVGDVIGGTETKTNKVLEEAMGGVLFIDEAYTLFNGGSNDFGKVAIDILNKVMDDKRSDLVVIFAGYENETNAMLNYNQGMKSRIPNIINFPDYTDKELVEIFMRYLNKNGRKIDKDARDYIEFYISNYSRLASPVFPHNARGIRTLFENVILEEHQIRIAYMTDPTEEDVALITKDDIPNSIKDCVDELIDLDNNPPLVEDVVDASDNENKSTQNSVSANKATHDIFEVKDVPIVETKSNSYVEIDDDLLNYNFQFNWTDIPNMKFDDIAGLDKAKELVKAKVIIPLKNPKLFEGYGKTNGGGLFLYGPPGTGKTMVAAAIANEVGAKFCTVVPSDLLSQGIGCTEKNIKELFKEARMFKCAIIYFDEMDALTPKNTKAQLAKQVRSELLTQINGIASYGDQTDNILFLIGSTNKPWDVDPTFLRPGRFGSHVYVGLPNEDARRYIIEHKLDKIGRGGVVTINEDIDMDTMVSKTEGFNGSDITNLLDRVIEISAMNSLETGEKIITNDDVIEALSEVSSTVQGESLKKLAEWRAENDKNIQ